MCVCVCARFCHNTSKTDAQGGIFFAIGDLGDVAAARKVEGRLRRVVCGGRSVMMDWGGEWVG